MQEYSIERSGIKNLDFTGEVIGQSNNIPPRVKIYRTKGLTFVGQLDAQMKFTRAEHFAKPEDVINWFKSESGNQITTEVQDAIEDAASKDDAFKAAWNEHVD